MSPEHLVSLENKNAFEATGHMKGSGANLERLVLNINKDNEISVAQDL